MEFESCSVETWYELRLSTDEYCGYKVDGYFKDRDLAITVGKGKGWYGADGTVREVFVLTKDGKTGRIVSSEQIELADEDALKAATVKIINKKLSSEEKQLLGLA